MNRGGENNNIFSWKTNDGWSYLNLNDNQIGSGVTLEGDKLLDPSRFDTYQPLTVAHEVIEESTNAGKKRNPPNRKKNGKKIVEPNFGADGAGDRGGLKHKLHIWTARERRKKIGILFDTHRALIPNIPAKAKGGTGICQSSETSTVEEMYMKVAIEIMSFATPK
ncbi:hypothetical protein EJD97_002878 [Solanum chilense]|uniref:BHLH domain-containing protein n=1 Tax=Solanum chilense TaxID=4083 RepID=A0A6N2AKW3_SOLCI|nr:hypothetical protein EJD97_002878 [Solanum chilense]